MVLTTKDDGEELYHLVVNMEKAREIHRNKLRAARKLLFESLDVQFMRALECGENEVQMEIAIKKERLRDLPSHPSINASNCCADLRKLTVHVLMSIT